MAIHDEYDLMVNDNRFALVPRDQLAELVAALNEAVKALRMVYVPGLRDEMSNRQMKALDALSAATTKIAKI